MDTINKSGTLTLTSVDVWWHVDKVTVRADLAGEAQHSAWTQTRFFT